MVCALGTLNATQEANFIRWHSVQVLHARNQLNANGMPALVESVLIGQIALQ